MVRNELSNQELIATERFNLISSFVDESLTKKDRLSLMKAKSLTEGPSLRTLKRYYDNFITEGFNGLKPKSKDHSATQVITPEILKAATDARRENPQRSIKDIIYILEVSGITPKNSVKRSTLQRYFQKCGFSKKQMTNYTKTPGVATRRYRKSHRMEQLQSDFKYASYLPIGKNHKMIQIYYIGWIDNSSRMVLDGKFYSRQTFYEVEDSLKRVIMQFGVPSTILLDNGKPFSSKKLEVICAKCSIKKIHAKPFSPQTKGLIEVYNSYLNKFISEAAIEKYETLEELNLNYEAWNKEYYNNITHAGLKEGTPISSFTGDTRPLRFISNETLKDAFSTRVTRNVKNDCTVSINGITYDIENPNLIGFEVNVIFDSHDMETITVRKVGYDDIIAKPLVIGPFVRKEKQIISEDRSLKITTKSTLLEGIRNSYATDNLDYDKDLAAKAVRRNELEANKKDNQSFAYSLSDVEEVN
jgi:hypothetical protein